MKQILVNLYKFSELSETAQKKAIEKQYDISIDYEWWDFIYDDARRIGLKINAFDIYRKSIDITYEDNPDDVANAIFKEFGEGVDIYRYAKEYITNYNNSLGTFRSNQLNKSRSKVCSFISIFLISCKPSCISGISLIFL